MSTADYEVLVDWENDGDFSDDSNDMTDRVLAAGDLSFSYGRDQARSLSAMRAGETAFKVNNESKDYSPDNASSPLYGMLEPGRAVLIRATFNSTTYNLFRGYLDGYEMQPASNSGVSKVAFTALDVLHKLKQGVLSTPMHESIQTGAAIDALLDAIGWPCHDRDIDAGASTLRWWWEEGTDGLTALKKIVDSEGLPAFAYVDPEGKFVFRDRHHRIKAAESTTVQATFSGTGSEPLFSEPFTYDIGWRDLINQVIMEIDERAASTESVVWSTDTPFVLNSGENKIIEIKTETPFINAQVPHNTSALQDVDFNTGDINNVTVQLSRTSGQSLQIIFTATANVIVTKIRLRAQSVPVARKVKIIAENASSILKHGVRTAQDLTPAWVNQNDAYAISRLVVAQRGERLPVVKITVNNANDTRLTQILERDLSDRIHVTETAESGVDDDFFIEQIEHTISKAGKLHRVVFGCEKALLASGVEPNFFTFDKSGSGFNQGVFGEDGHVPDADVFILDSTADNGKLNVAGLGF